MNDDIQNAREHANRKLFNTKVPLLVKITPTIIDFFIIAVWGLLTIFLVIKSFGVFKSSVDVSLIMGIWAGVTGMATTILNYHRGSSQGSKDKNEQLKGMRDDVPTK